MKRFFHLLLLTAMLAAATAMSGADIPAAAAEAVVEVRSAAVEITNPSVEAIDVAIYAVTGTVVRQSTGGAGEAEVFELPAGYYIVKAGNAAAVRVLVK